MIESRLLSTTLGRDLQSMQLLNRSALLIWLCALNALSTDIYLSSIPLMAQQWQESVAAVNQSLAWFVLAFAVGQLMFGPLLDKYGRKLPLLLGLIVFSFGNLICALAPDIHSLYLGRAIAGLGASAGVTGSFAICRDLYQGKALTNALANIAAAVALAPILAPALGTAITHWLDWRWIFALMTLTGLLVAVWAWVVLPQSAKESPNSTEETDPPISFWRDSRFYLCLMANGAGFAALFAFISSSSGILITEFAQSPFAFSLWFAANAVVYMIASKLVGRLRQGLTNVELMIMGAVLMMLGSMSMSVLSEQFAVWGFISAMSLITAGLAWIAPSANSKVLEIYPQQAATVSGIMGAARLLAGFLAALWLSLQSEPLLMPLIFVLVTSSVIAVAVAIILNLRVKKGQIAAQSC